LQDFLPLITGGTGALVVMALWVWALATGKIHSDPEFSKLEAERDYWRDAYGRQAEATAIERRVVNETAQGAAVNNQLLTAFLNLANGRPAATPAPPAAPDLGLTP
jgi:hypothetical protein